MPFDVINSIFRFQVMLSYLFFFSLNCMLLKFIYSLIFFHIQETFVISHGSEWTSTHPWREKPQCPWSTQFVLLYPRRPRLLSILTSWSLSRSGLQQSKVRKKARAMNGWGCCRLAFKQDGELVILGWKFFFSFVFCFLFLFKKIWF